MSLFHSSLPRLLSKTSLSTIFVCELLSNNSLLSMLFSMSIFLLFCFMLNTLLQLSSSKSILLMSGLVVVDVFADVLSIFFAQLVVLILVVAVVS